MQIVLDIPNESDLDALLPLLKRLHISVSTLNGGEKPKLELEEALKVVRAGCDMKSFGDALTWQKEVRRDRELPFRD